MGPGFSYCTDCRWLDIQADADRQAFWCIKRGEDVSERVPGPAPCADFERLPSQDPDFSLG